MAFGFNPFSQREAEGYKPNKANFQWGAAGPDGGVAGGSFYKNSKSLFENGPQGPQADMTNANQSRGLGLQSRARLDADLNQLGARRDDEKLSQAYQQLQMGQTQNERAALALARSGGGGGAAQAAALRNAQFQSAQGQQATNQAAGLARAQEVAAIDQQLIAGRAQQRAMDLQAQGLDAQSAFQQAQLEMQQRGLNMQGALGFGGLSNQANEGALRGMMGYEGLMGSGQNAASMANAQFDAQRDAGLLGMIGTLGAGAIIASDVRAKTEVAPMGMPPIRAAGGMNSPQMAPPEPTGPSKMDQLGQAQRIGQMFAGSAGGGSMVNPQSMLMSPEAVVAMSDEHSKQQIQSLQEVNRYLTSQLRNVGDMMGPIPAKPSRLAMPSDPRARDAVASAVKQHAANMGEATKDAIRWSQDDRRRARLVDAARGTGPQPDVITENPKVGDVARDFSEPLSKAEQDALMLGQLRASGVLRPAEAYPTVSPAEQQTMTRPVTSDKRAKEDAHLAGQLEGMQTAILSGLRRPLPSGSSEGRLPDVPTFQRPPGEMVRPAVREPNTAALDAAHGSVDQMAAIPSYSWRYRPEHVPEANARMGLPPDSDYGARRKVGPMAQDLEQNPLTAGAVATGPDGMKRVDAGQLTMANTGALADLARYAEEQEARLRRLEASRSRVPYPKAGGDR